MLGGVCCIGRVCVRGRVCVGPICWVVCAENVCDMCVMYTSCLYYILNFT